MPGPFYRCPPCPAGPKGGTGQPAASAPVQPIRPFVRTGQTRQVLHSSRLAAGEWWDEMGWCYCLLVQEQEEGLMDAAQGSWVAHADDSPPGVAHGSYCLLATV